MFVNDRYAMADSDKMLLEKCLNLVVDHSGLGDKSKWTIREYEHLSEQIEEATHIKISSSTLKRLYKGSGATRPQLSTLNALARFIAYDNWYDFARQPEEQANNQITQRPTDNTKSRRGLFWLTAIITLTAISLYWILFFEDKTKDHESIPFTAELKIEKGVPNTVTFKYELDEMKYDSAWIIENRYWNRIFPLPQNSRQQSFVIYYPGSYLCNLMVDGQERASTKFTVKTDGWMAFVRRELKEVKPIYFDPNLHQEQTFLYVNPDLISARGIDISKKYITSYSCFDDFENTDGDNLRIKVRLRSSIAEGGQTCQHIWVNLLCENNEHWVSLVDPGCTGIVDVKFSDHWVEGQDHDLSMFGFDLNEKHDLDIKISNKLAVVAVDGNKIYTTSYQAPAGELQGIHIQFLGTGSVDFVALYNADLQPVYLSTR